MTSQFAVPGDRIHAARASRLLPPPYLEYVYYAQIFYATMGPALGISFGRLGVATLALLAATCVLRTGGHLLTLLKAIALPLACGVSFVGIQVVVHGESLMGNAYVREFVPWMLALIIVQWLGLRRGFLHRSALAVLFIGLLTLPYLTSFANDSTRSGLERTIGIANPNDLGAWFGFCFVYLTILGLETRRNSVRAISWAAALVCLGVVGLTVSRAPLLAAGISTVLAFRRLLKRGFVPFLTLLVVAWVAYGLGLFERSATMYAQRGLEESGRFLVWPVAIQRFLGSILTGVGVSNVDSYVPGMGFAVSPHNGFIFIAVASGLVPLSLFVAYWLQLFGKSFGGHAAVHEDMPFHGPLLSYSLLIMMGLNQAFMVPWMIVTLASVGGKGLVLSPSRPAMRRPDTRREARRGEVQVLAHRGRARPQTARNSV